MNAGSCTGVVGILGAGQLGRMLALAGLPLGLRFRFLDPDPGAPAADVGELIAAAYDDEQALAEFSRGLDGATYEFENVPARIAAFLGSNVRAPWTGHGRPHSGLVFPPAAALETCQDRLLEKQLFERTGLGCARYAALTTPSELRAAIASHIGLPCILKTRRFGYDGKGQAVIRALAEIDDAFAAVAGTVKEPALIVESFVPFARELSLICIRSRTGEMRFYPLVQNHHQGGILRVSIAPAPGLTAALQEQAQASAAKLLDAMAYVGVMTVELFEVIDPASGQAHLLGNEMAPRVHNSGHWTIDAAECSQFENHLRAVLGWPLGPTGLREGLGCAAMLNLIGGNLVGESVVEGSVTGGGLPGGSFRGGSMTNEHASPPESPRDSLPDASTLDRPGWMHLHLYGKTPRPGRKIGHITITAPDAAALEARIEHARALVPSAGR